MLSKIVDFWLDYGKIKLRKITMTSKILQKIIAVGAILVMGLGIATPVMATDGPDSTGSGSFLGLVHWYSDVEDVVDSGTTKLHDNCDGISNCMTLANFIATVAMNVLTDATVIAAYLTLGFVIYGGYQYIFSSGDAGKVATGKKTLTSAFIGLAIVMLSYVIFNTIKVVLLSAAGADCTPVAGETCLVNVDAGKLFDNTSGWVIGISGIVAAIFLVYGGITYITSSGDTAKLEKAKKMILYSLIGLAIVGLAQLITSAISGAIRESTKVEESAAVKVITVGKGGQK